MFEEASMKDRERYEEELKSYKPSENFLKRKAEYEAKVMSPTVADPQADQSSGRLFHLSAAQLAPGIIPTLLSNMRLKPFTARQSW